MNLIDDLKRRFGAEFPDTPEGRRLRAREVQRVREAYGLLKMSRNDLEDVAAFIIALLEWTNGGFFGMATKAAEEVDAERE